MIVAACDGRAVGRKEGAYRTGRARFPSSAPGTRERRRVEDDEDELVVRGDEGLELADAHLVAERDDRRDQRRGQRDVAVLRAVAGERAQRHAVRRRHEEPARGGTTRICAMAARDFLEDAAPHAFMDSLCTVRQ